MAKAKKTVLDNDNARAIAEALGKTLFERKSGYSAKDNAQRNLDERTHYVSDSTLKSFHSRVMSARDTDHGLVFAIIESVAKDYQNHSRGFRFVAFDIEGTVINDRASATDTVSTSAKAEKDMWAFLDTFDVLAHYKKVMEYKADRYKVQAAHMLRIAKSIKV